MNYDVNVDSKFLTKLLDAVVSGIGAVSAITVGKKLALAKGEILRIEAQAEADTRAIKEGTKIIDQNGNLIDTPAINPQENSIASSAISRLQYQETKRQRNIESIFRKAAEYKNEFKEISDESVDEDWIAKFFQASQDVSNEKMQEIWSRILAGEVANPGTFSLRTIDVLKNLSYKEAVLFEKIRPYIIKNFYPKNSSVDKVSGILYGDLVFLEDAGLIESSGQKAMTFNGSFPDAINPDRFIASINVSEGLAILISVQKKDTPISCNAYLLTKAGLELHLHLAKPEVDIDYLKIYAQHWVREDKLYIPYIVRFSENRLIEMTEVEKIQSE